MNLTKSSAVSSRDDAGHATIPKTSKICGVCGDVARCYHFGGLCCASCKAFFRRAVVNDRYKQYRCVYGGSCRIDVISRKHCSHCRLKQCLAIGMDKKWFMSDEMRAELKMKSMKKLRNNQEQLMILTQKICRQLAPADRSVDRTSGLILSPDHAKEIHLLVHLCRRAYQVTEFPKHCQSSDCQSALPGQTAVIFASVIRRVFFFLRSVPQLQQLDESSQMSLLKERGMESLIIMSALTFDPIGRKWASKEGTSYNTLISESYPIHVCEKDFERLHGPAVMRKHFDTITSLLLSLNVDEQIVVLLALVAFFAIDDNQQGNSAEAAHILVIQEHFIELLKRYVHWKMGPEISEKVFARYILKLSDVREVHNLHKVAQLRLSSDEIHQLEHQLGGLALLKGGSQH